MSGYLLKISRHGEIRREAFEPGDSLAQLQRAVGGWIERVEIPAFTREGLDVDCYVDEEGMLKADPIVNIAISMMAGRQVVGDAVLIMHDGEGGSAGIPEPLVATLATYVRRAFAYGILCHMRYAPSAQEGRGDEAEEGRREDAE